MSAETVTLDAATVARLIELVGEFNAAADDHQRAVVAVRIVVRLEHAGIGDTEVTR